MSPHTAQIGTSELFWEPRASCWVGEFCPDNTGLGSSSPPLCQCWCWGRLAPGLILGSCTFPKDSTLKSEWTLGHSLSAVRGTPAPSQWNYQVKLVGFYSWKAPVGWLQVGDCPGMQIPLISTRMLCNSWWHLHPWFLRNVITNDLNQVA